VGLGSAGDEAGRRAGVDAAAVRLRAAGDAGAGLAAGVDAAAVGLGTARDDGWAGEAEVGGTAGLRQHRTAATGVDAAAGGRATGLAAGVDTAADRRSAGGDRPATEILGQRALRKLGKWIHFLSLSKKVRLTEMVRGRTAESGSGLPGWAANGRASGSPRPSRNEERSPAAALAAPSLASSFNSIWRSMWRRRYTPESIRC